MATKLVELAFSYLPPFFPTCRACDRQITFGNSKLPGFCCECANRLHAASACGKVLGCGHVSIMHYYQLDTSHCKHTMCARGQQTEKSPCAYCGKALASSSCVTLKCGHVFHYGCFSSKVRMTSVQRVRGELYLEDVCCAICSRIFSWRGCSTLELEIASALAATLECACKVGDLYTVKKLANKGLEGSFLHNAAFFGQVEAIKILVKKCKTLDINQAVGLMNYTPMHAAVTGGHEKAIILLAALGADVNVRQSTKITPLHQAAKEGKGDIVKLLIKLGANVHAKAHYNVTPLHFAARSGDCMSVRWLVKHGANVNVRDDHGNTPFQIVTRQGNASAVQLLMDAGARVDDEILKFTIDPQIKQILLKETTPAEIKHEVQDKCTVCLNQCHLPKKLKCGHSFCWECLGNLLSKSFTSCPNCRAPIELQ